MCPLFSGGGDPIVVTRDLDEAREAMAAVYAPHRLVAHDGSPLDFRLRHVSAETMTVGMVRYGADAETVVPPPRSSYHVNIPMQGNSGVTQGRRTGVARAGRTAALFGPAEPFAVRWTPDASHYVLKVAREALEKQLVALAGRSSEGTLEFDLTFSLSTPRGQSFVATVGHLRNELTRSGGTAAVPLVRAQLESYLLTQLLLAVPHSHLDEVNAPRDVVRRRHVQDAMDFIHDHAARPISGPDIAGAACVSLRALQAGFRDELGVSPVAYLRDVRLARVHAELQHGADGGSVSEVAHRWGFPHLGRFAEQYRRKYGELPSETLRRHRP